MEFYNSDKPDDRLEGEEFSFVWVHSFPLFKWNEKEQKFESEHHPFTMPADLNAFKEAYESKDKEKILALKSCSYDLVLNGQEIGSGSQRIHIPEIQKQVFEILGLSEKEIEEKFGFFLEAYNYGAPFHSGMAIGLDRLLMILLKRQSIKDVIPFPKSTNANSLMDNCPSPVEIQQLEDLGIEIIKR
jgi:aspartyl-tRNA synthetase